MILRKRNEIVRGVEDYSLLARRASNFIYYAIQKENLYDYRFITFRFATLRKAMGLMNNEDYVQRMKDALSELMYTIELHNYTHIDGKKYNWFATRYLNEVRFEKKENGEWVAHIEINNTIKELMKLKKGNFTELDLLIYQNKMRTKYGMKLYEFLKSFQSYRYVTFTANHIRKLLSLENSKTYKHFSDLKRLIERQVKEIKDKTDLNRLELEITKDKAFKFIINPATDKKTPTETDKERVLNNLVQKSFIRV